MSRVTVFSSRKLALIGSNGMLAQKVREQAAVAGYTVTPYDLPEFDITNRDQVLSEISQLRPDVIVNCAAFTNVDGCETQEDLATRVNGHGAGNLAEAVLKVGATLVHISTDYVFDGRKREPYLETDPVGPLSAYGRSKLAGEQTILASGLKSYFIIRTSWLYGPHGKNFVETIIRLSRERDELRIVADQVGSPTYTGDLAVAIFRLLGTDRDEEVVMKNPLRVTDPLSPVTASSSRVTDPLSPITSSSSRVTGFLSPPFGIYHFANSGHCSWYEFAVEIIEQVKGRGEELKVKRVVPIRTEEYPLPATRPAYSVFSREKYRLATGAEIPGWRESLSRYLAEGS